MTISFAWHDYQAQRALVYRQAHKPLYTLTISLLDIVTVQRLYCKKDCQIFVTNKLTERFNPNPWIHYKIGRKIVAKKRKQQQQNGAHRKDSKIAFFFFLSPIYQQDQCMEMVISTSVTTFLISSSLAPCSASFLPSCSSPIANGVVFLWILKTYKEAQKKRVQLTTTTAAKKKTNCCEEIWCKSGVQRVRRRTSNESTSLFVSWKRAGQVIVPG